MAKIKGINRVSFAVENLDEAIRSAEENLGGGLMMKFESTEQKYLWTYLQKARGG